jgi:proteasome lid subunit RPN8/RPN11
MPADADLDPPSPTAEAPVPTGLHETVAAWMAAAWPEEACGILLGTPGDPPCVRRAVLCQNVSAEPQRRFELDPLEHLAAGLDARTEGLEIVGTWHSHPDAPPVPSGADARWAWRHSLHLIGRTERGGTSQVRAWVWDDGFRELVGPERVT